MRVGIGYDIHKLEKGRKLKLGGEEIHFRKGLIGHSDADVVLHAISDALLGAAGLGDIGMHFPNSDPQYKDISSMVLLARVYELIGKNKYRVNNVDVMIIAEEPKISPFAGKMKIHISRVLHIDASRVNIKATTAEGVGSIGRGETIASYAAVMLEEVT